MNANLGLQAASGLVNFVLKTTLEFLVCMLLVRIAGSARSRFNLWLTMLLAFGCQWAWTLVDVLRSALVTRVAISTSETAPAAIAVVKRIPVQLPAAGAVGELMAALLAVYAVVVVWRMAGRLAARIRLGRAMRYKASPQEHMAALFRQVARQTSAPPSELWVLPGISSPATLGWLRPRVIVPPSCEMQDEAELEAVFWHELTHVARRDALWNGLVRACCDLLWFHPAVHRSAAALNAERELACDAAVVAEHPQSRDVYATCLLRFATGTEFSATAIEMASSAALLTERVKSILSDRPKPGWLLRAARAAANLSLVGAMAATVPGLNILFAAEQQLVPEIKLPGAPVAMRRHIVRNARQAGVNAGRAAEQASVESRPAFASSPIAHDEALAAEHRAALGILTESTGMDAPAEEGRAAVPGVPGSLGKPGTGNSPTAWTTVAVDAAERIALASGGRDSDDRH